MTTPESTILGLTGFTSLKWRPAELLTQPSLTRAWMLKLQLFLYQVLMPQTRTSQQAFKVPSEQQRLFLELRRSEKTPRRDCKFYVTNSLGLDKLPASLAKPEFI